MKLFFSVLVTFSLTSTLVYGRIFVSYPKNYEGKKNTLVRLLTKKMKIPMSMISLKMEDHCSSDYRFDINICVNAKKKGELTFPLINELFIQKKYKQFKEL